MIAKVSIVNAEIVSATVIKDDGSTRVETTERDFVWPGKWDVTIDPFSGIVCTSNRTGKETTINQVRFEVKFNGLTELSLKTEQGRKVIKTERSFTIPGNFTGVLNLVYESNGHRGAWFVSEEYTKFLRERQIDWVVTQEANEFELDLNGLFTHSVLGSGSFTTDRRVLQTDGRINIISVRDRSKITISDATWVLLKKKHVESGKTQTVLFTDRNYSDLEIPTVGYEVDEQLSLREMDMVAAV